MTSLNNTLIYHGYPEFSSQTDSVNIDACLSVRVNQRIFVNGRLSTRIY